MKKLVSIILIGILIVACQNLNSIEPPQELKALDRLGQFIDTTFYADTAFFQIDPYINTENSAVISVGSFKNFNASVFMKFTRMPQDSGATYDSVFVILTPRFSFPETGNPINLQVSELQEEWPDSVNSLPQFHNYRAPTPFYTFTLSPDDSNLIIIPIDINVFNRWVEAGRDNFGLLISAQNNTEGFFKEFRNFYSEDPEQWPKLIYKTILDTTVEYDTTNIGIASSVYDYDLEKPENIFEMAKEKKELIISSGIASRVVVRFNALQQLPVNSLIYKADMEFDVKDQDFFDPALQNRLKNPEQPNGYYLRWVASISEDGSKIEIDSSFANNSYYSYSVYNDGEQIHFIKESDQVRFGKGYIQGFLNRTYDSVWFYLQFANEYQHLAIRRIKSFKEGGIRLRLHYYLVKNEGF